MHTPSFSLFPELYCTSHLYFTMTCMYFTKTTSGFIFIKQLFAAKTKKQSRKHPRAVISQIMWRHDNKEYGRGDTVISLSFRGPERKRQSNHGGTRTACEQFSSRRHTLWHQAKNNQPCHRGYWTMRWCVHREGKTNTTQCVYCAFETLSYCVCGEEEEGWGGLLYIQQPLFITNISFSFIPLFPNIRAPSEQYWLRVIAKWSQLRVVNSKAIWLIRALRPAIHHKSHPPPSPIGMQGAHWSW